MKFLEMLCNFIFGSEQEDVNKTSPTRLYNFSDYEPGIDWKSGQEDWDDD